MIVIAGCGWAQREGGPIEDIRPGDVVWFAPGEKHWHGASPTTAMTHIAIQENLDGKVVDWMQKVSDEQYHNTTDEKVTVGEPTIPELSTPQCEEAWSKAETLAPDNAE